MKKTHALFLVPLLVLFQIPQGIAADDPLIYVTNATSNDVSVIDPATDTVTATIPVGTAPQSVKVSPDGAFVYVANKDSQDLSVIDTSNNTVTDTIAIGGQPYYLAINPDGDRLYVSDQASDTVVVVDTDTNTVITAVAVGDTPRGLDISPDGDFVYVPNFGDESVSVIDTSDNTVADTIALPDGTSPISLVVSHDGSLLYVANFLGGDLLVVDIDTQAVVDSVDAGMENLGLLLTRDDSTLYVFTGSDNSLDIVGTDDMVIDNIVAMGNSPCHGVLNLSQSKLYVAETNTNTVGIVNTTTLVRTAIAVGTSPSDIASQKLHGDPVLGLAVATDPNTVTSKGYVVIGGIFDLIATITNSGPGDAENTVFTVDPFDGGLFEFEDRSVREEDAGGNVLATFSCGAQAGWHNCDIGTVQAGTTRLIRFQMFAEYNSYGTPYGEYIDTRIASGDVTAADITHLHAVLKNYPDCACNLDAGRPSDLSQYLRDAILYLAIMLLPIVLLRLRKSRMLLGFALVALLWGGSAEAATPFFSVNPDVPTLGAQGIIYTLGAKKAEVPYSFAFDTMYELDQAKPLAASRGRMRDLLTHYLGFAISPYKTWQLDVILPIYSYANFNLGGTTTKAGIGDALLRFHVPVWSGDKLNFALIPFVSIPLGNENYLLGDKYPTGGLRAALDWQMSDRWYAALNLGIEARQTVSSANFNEKGRLISSLGAAFRASNQVKLKADLTSSTAINDPFQHQPSSPLEAMGGIDVALKNHPVTFNVSAGGPLVRGAVSPTFRAEAGVTVGFGKSEKKLSSQELSQLQPTILFASASSKISREGQTALKNAAGLLNKYPKLQLIVAEGHTDAKGSRHYNQKLSVKRAQAAKNYLVGQGVSPGRIQVSAFAEQKPVDSNTTEAGRSKNRRVVLRLGQ